MNSRERVLCALNHEEPDRVPIFFGTSGGTTMLASAYDLLKAHLGIQRETRVFWRALQYSLLDEDKMVRCHADGRPLIPKVPPSSLTREIADNEFADLWGITRHSTPQSHYYEMMGAPLADATIDDLDKFLWPDFSQPSRFAGLAEQAQGIHQAGYAVVALSGISPFGFSYILRGIENFFGDLVALPEFAQAFLRKLTTLMCDSTIALLNEVGEHNDVIVTGDNLGGHETTLISPEMYRKRVKPLHVELFSAIKSRSKGKIFYHSDSNIYSILCDLLEVGVDRLNPVHVAAADIGGTAQIKRKFGNRLSFCGAIDIVRVLPRGPIEGVRAEVRCRIKDLAPGGCYILASVHCIQLDVPPGDVLAMFDKVVKSGGCPIKLQNSANS